MNINSRRRSFFNRHPDYRRLMHARELIELAALVSAHGSVVIQSNEPIPADSIEQYWASSKVRLDRWSRSLKDFTLQADSGAWRREQDWREVRGVLEEVLTSEILTRVWTAVLCAHDRACGTDQVESVARSVLIGHNEARNRVLKLLVRGTAIKVDAALKLNRLRRRAERWTDLLVGRVSSKYSVAEFAIDPKRAHDFAEETLGQRGSTSTNRAWPLLMASLREAFRRELSVASPNADVNARIAAAILACFPSELFDTTGLYRSLWLMRVISLAEDAENMVADLLGPGQADSLSRW